jgi:hypothetical protein
MRPPLSEVLRRRRLKVEYLESRKPPEPEPESSDPEAPMEEIVVDLDELQDPFDLKAGIVPGPRFDSLDPDIEREAIDRMDAAHSERTESIERLRDRRAASGPPWHRVRRGGGFVDIEPTDAEYRRYRRRRRDEPIPYALPGENFEQAAKRHRGIQKSSELLEMQEATRKEIEAPEIPDSFGQRAEPRDARAEQPRKWDSAGEEQSRLARIARSVGMKRKKNRSQSEQARAQKRDEHGRFAS